MIILYAIGYLIMGMLVFHIEGKLDNHYRLTLLDKYPEEQYVLEDDIFKRETNWALDEYFHRTQWIPKDTNWKVIAVGFVLAAIIWILWPVAAIISPIYNTIVYRGICKKAES